MTASREPDADPQQDAAALSGVPKTPEESARARDLAALFGNSADQDSPQDDGRSAATRDELAALFAQPARPLPADPAPSPEPLPDGFWDPVAVADSEAVAATVAEPESRPVPEAETVSEAETVPAPASAADPVPMPEPAAEPESATGAEMDPAEPQPESAAEALAWLGFDDEPEPEPAAEPEPTGKIAAAGWLGIVRGGDDATAAVAPVAADAAVDAPTTVLPETEAASASGASAGAFFPAERRGIRAWSPRVRWSVAISIVLLIAVVAGSVFIARSIAANNLAAQQLAAAVAELEAAEALAVEPESLLATAIAAYDDTVELARATADGAAPPLAAVAGMTAQPLLDASNAALAALVAQLDATTFEDAPESYEREEIDLADIAEVEAATRSATDHAGRVAAATREVSAAQAALQEKVDALRVAQVALGASLPETAVLIVGENRRALQSFRDAVIAAAVAVGTAQAAGGSGDAELLAYAAAVTALRGDQARVVDGTTPTQPTRPANPAPQPTPTTDPVPPPAPEPEPEPTDPVPVPDPSITP